MNANYPRAFGCLASAVHRALRELRTYDEFKDRRTERIDEATRILCGALRDLEFNYGIELHWPDDVKEKSNAKAT